MLDLISILHFTLTLTLLMNLPPKAALKPPALQTLRAAVERQRLAPAFGVRAALAPLFIRRSFKAGLRGSRRDIFRGNLSMRERKQLSGRDDLPVKLRSYFRLLISPKLVNDSPSPSGPSGRAPG